MTHVLLLAIAATSIARADEEKSVKRSPASVGTAALPELPEDMHSWLDAQCQRVRDLKDYTFVLASRERIGETLGEHEFQFIKVRHEPFSLFIADIGQRPARNRHYLFVEGERKGRFLGGIDGVYSGNRELSPNSYIAMHGRRHPLTECDLAHVLERFRDLIAPELKHGKWKLTRRDGTKLDGHESHLLVLERPERFGDSALHNVEVLWDADDRWPVRLSRSDWAAADGTGPELVEEYHFLKLQTDSSLTDSDFDERNADYFFHPLPPGHSRRKPIVGAGVNVSEIRASLPGREHNAERD